MRRYPMAMWNGSLEQPDERQEVQSVTLNTTSHQMMIAWLESQPGYWFGRAQTRRPPLGTDPLSADYLTDLRLASEYERKAEELRR